MKERTIRSFRRASPPRSRPVDAGTTGAHLGDPVAQLVGQAGAGRRARALRRRRPGARARPRRARRRRVGLLAAPPCAPRACGPAPRARRRRPAIDRRGRSRLGGPRGGAGGAPSDAVAGARAPAPAAAAAGAGRSPRRPARASRRRAAPRRGAGRASALAAGAPSGPALRRRRRRRRRRTGAWRRPRRRPGGAARPRRPPRAPGSRGKRARSAFQARRRQQGLRLHRAHRGPQRPAGVRRSRGRARRGARAAAAHPPAAAAARPARRRCSLRAGTSPGPSITSSRAAWPSRSARLAVLGRGTGSGGGSPAARSQMPDERQLAAVARSGGAPPRRRSARPPGCGPGRVPSASPRDTSQAQLGAQERGLVERRPAAAAVARAPELLERRQPLPAAGLVGVPPQRPQPLARGHAQAVEHLARHVVGQRAPQVRLHQQRRRPRAPERLVGAVVQAPAPRAR